MLSSSLNLLSSPKSSLDGSYDDVQTTYKSVPGAKDMSSTCEFFLRRAFVSFFLSRSFLRALIDLSLPLRFAFAFNQTDPTTKATGFSPAPKSPPSLSPSAERPSPSLPPRSTGVKRLLGARTAWERWWVRIRMRRGWGTRFWVSR